MLTPKSFDPKESEKCSFGLNILSRICLIQNVEIIHNVENHSLDTKLALIDTMIEPFDIMDMLCGLNQVILDLKQVPIVKVNIVTIISLTSTKYKCYAFADVCEHSILMMGKRYSSNHLNEDHDRKNSV